MEKNFYARLSESHFKNLFLYEITFFLVFDLCKTLVWSINEWMQKAKVIINRNREFNSKIDIFLQEILALLKSILVIDFIEKKKLSELIIRRGGGLCLARRLFKCWFSVIY